MKIIRTSRYIKDLRRMGVNDVQRQKLEQEIVNNPEVGKVIPGLEGLRKFALPWQVEESAAVVALSIISC